MMKSIENEDKKLVREAKRRANLEWNIMQIELERQEREKFHKSFPTRLVTYSRLRKGLKKL
jgi:hypothetical protein